MPLTEAEQDGLAQVIGTLIAEERKAFHWELAERDRRLGVLEVRMAQLRNEPQLIGFDK